MSLAQQNSFKQSRGGGGFFSVGREVTLKAKVEDQREAPMLLWAEGQAEKCRKTCYGQ